MLQCLLDEARQDSDSDEDTDEDESDESEDESEENNKCDNIYCDNTYCGCVLSSDVHIYCWKNGDDKLTVCSECYLRYRYWWDDENPENENVIREHKDI